MKSESAMSKPFHLCFSILLLLLSVLSGITAASLRDHRLRGAESNANAPDEDMLKALEYIQSLRQSAKDHQDSNLERSTMALDEHSDEPRSERQEDKSEELLQAVLSTLQQTEKAADQNGKKEEAITSHQKLPLMFEDNQEEDRSDESDRGNTFKRTNENVEEKYTPQTLATLQSVFDELGKVTNFNSKRQNHEEEDEDLLNVRDLVYDEGDWGQDEAEEERKEVERALDYVDDQENDERFVSKRSDDEDEGEMANLADFYLLKVLEQTEEEEQKKRELEEEEERRMERAAEFRSSIDPKLIYRLLQISQKYQIPPEDLINMLRGGERLKVAPVYTKKTYKKPQFFSSRLPVRQKTPDEMRTERILKILGLSGDENGMQSSLRKPYKNVYAWPAWRQQSPVSRQQQQKFSTKLKDDYDDTENEMATFLAARMLSKYPTYKSKTSQKREDEREEEAESFERAVQDYFDQLDSNRNEKRQLDLEQRGAEDFDNEDVIKLLNFVNPDEQDAKNTE